jgi:hypothetical protein
VVTRMKTPSQTLGPWGNQWLDFPLLVFPPTSISPPTSRPPSSLNLTGAFGSFPSRPWCFVTTRHVQLEGREAHFLPQPLLQSGSSFQSR